MVRESLVSSAQNCAKSCEFSSFEAQATNFFHNLIAPERTLTKGTFTGAELPIMCNKLHWISSSGALLDGAEQGQYS